MVNAANIGARATFGAALAEARSQVCVSQLELAARAGTTQRHLSYLERGRSSPGRSLVIRIGESLGLPPRERNVLLLSAGYAPVYPHSPPDEESIKPLRGALRQVLVGHGPFPALITDRIGTLLAGNEAVGLLLEGVCPDLLVPPVNIRRVALHPEGLAGRVINLAEVGRRVTEKMRSQLGRSPDPAEAALLAELQEYAGRAAPAPGFDYMGLAMPVHLASPAGSLRLLATLTTFSATVDATVTELRMEAFLPADADTATRLAALGATRRSNRPVSVPGLLQWPRDTESAN